MMNSMIYTLPNISVIICTYGDRWGQLKSAIDSVIHQNLAVGEIIIVVDHSPSFYQKICNATEGIMVVENAQSQGLSGSRNTGIKHASGDYIAFLDDDMVADPGWLENLMNVFEQDLVIATGNRISPAWIDIQPQWFPPELYWIFECSYKGMPKTTAPIRNPFNASMLFRREVFDEIGGFRTNIGNLPSGWEEEELCIRIKQRWPQHILLYVPSALVWHRIPHKLITWHHLAAKCYSEGFSKAIVAHLVGFKDGLSSEHIYSTRTVPLGIIRGIGTALSGNITAGLSRIGAIMLGSICTVAGYIHGSIAFTWAVQVRGHISEKPSFE
jgi:glycosyltransferase involved in cell wall biosynthesis